MTRRFLIFCVVLTVIFPFHVFSQQQNVTAGSLRDYVGLINQTYHPGIISYFEKFKEDLVKRGDTDAVKILELFLSGGFGSGFIYSDSKGNLYVLTNNHVIDQAHTISITFERQDGFKKKIENLKLIAADEENDIAILAFPAAEKPVTSGLTFISRQVDEGEDVFSAGFPGLGMTPVWQFGRGMISNAAARFPKSILDETLMGPFIQHTAQVDPGNSGGPLLVAQRNVPTGYAVAGINTLSGYRRQAANYAIPLSTVNTFIANALNPKPENFRAELDARLKKFTEGLGENKAVYPHIAEYLSSACVGENAEFAMAEVEKGSATIRRAVIDKMLNGLGGAMGYAVAWTIETDLRSGGAINAAIKEVEGSGEEYTVTFTINNKDVTSKWVRDYGNWKIRTFGVIASGDHKAALEKRKADKKAAEALRIDSDFHVEAGYANLFDKAPAAFYASIELIKVMSVNVCLAEGYSAVGLAFGFRGEFPVGKFGLMPYGRLGLEFQTDDGYKEFEKSQDGWAMGFPIAAFGQAGLKVTSAYVPGLFMGVGFQLNIFNMHDKDYKGELMKMGLAVTAGYAF